VFNSDDNLPVYYLKDEENVPEENSFTSNSSLATPGHMKKVEFSLDLDLFGGVSDYNDSIDADATDTAQNENNSNAGKYIQKTIIEQHACRMIFGSFYVDKNSMHG